ncbi:hypothetical protein [Streptomyces sp. NRRL F-3307]|nr:hypothetical protein [Streptomyces sp. NRRL F-3307]
MQIPYLVHPSNSASMPESWTEETMYTTRPSPTQACAAAHIGQCSPEV